MVVGSIFATTEERFANWIFGINIIGLGLAGLVFAQPPDRWTIVRLFIALQHFVVGGLLLTRSPVGVGGSLKQICAAIPSLVICGVAFKYSPAPHAWPGYSQVVFAAATIFGVASLLCLGRNFAIFPALRGISTNGPYQWIRHPIYSAELMMVVATVLAGPHKWSLLALAILVPSLVYRIRTEENLLGQDPAYTAYRQRVPWRLLPWIW